jgi:hypothetical protein
MTRKHAWLLAVLAVVGSALIMGYRALEPDVGAPTEYPRNGNANHHPKHPVNGSS